MDSSFTLGDRATGCRDAYSLVGPDGFRLQETVWSQPQYLGESPPECWRSQLVVNAVKATPLRPHSLNSMASFALLLD